MTDRPTTAVTPPVEQKAVRRRQLVNARVTAWVLAAFVLLTFAVTIAKISINH